MPRKRHRRKILESPRFKGYKPYGANEISKDSVDLFYEEYEAIKLADYHLLNHKEAGFFMGVSRATFARIYENARRKIAHAMVEAKEIKAVPGSIMFDNTSYLCNDCNKQFTTKELQYRWICPTCSSGNFNVIQK
ncbi:MAG: DUF134 domain-containing protein [Bacteroidales bacterium]